MVFGATEALRAVVVFPDPLPAVGWIVTRADMPAYRRAGKDLSADFVVRTGSAELMQRMRSVRQLRARDAGLEVPHAWWYGATWHFSTRLHVYTARRFIVPWDRGTHGLAGMVPLAVRLSTNSASSCR